MKRVMKYVALASMMVMALGSLKQAWAASSNDTLTLTVTPGCTRGVTIRTEGNALTYDFASVNFSATTGTTKAITVKNTGSCGDTWTLSVGSVSGTIPAWASNDGTAVTTDKFNLYALFNTAQPTTTAITAATNIVKATSPNACTTGGSGNYVTNGDGSCTGVAPSASKSVWLALVMPTGQTDATSAQVTIPLVVTTAN